MSFGRKTDEPAGEPSSTTPAPAEPVATPTAATGPAPVARRGGTATAGRRAAGGLNTALTRTVATVGIVSIGVALGAILVSQDVAGWITGLVVSLVSVALMGVVWRPRTG